MLLIDILAAVAAEELERIREEEQRKKKMQNRAEPIRQCRLKRTEHQKTNVRTDDDDNAVSLADHDDHLPGTRIESKPDKIFPLKFKLNLKKKEIGKDDDDDGSKKNEKNKGKTEGNNGSNPHPDSANKFTNKKRKPGADNVTNIPLYLPTKTRNKKRKQESDNGPNPPPDLPVEFKNKILRKARGGQVGEEVLVIQKTLTSTDLQDHQNRFSIPLNQVRNKFLSEEDERFLKGRDADGHCNVIEVGMIEPEGEVESVNLTRWVMSKLSGKPSISYVLNGEGWKSIKSCNALKVGNVVQLWAVQIEGKPCLVFVKLGED